LIAPEPDAEKPKSYFKRALAVARQQQAKILGTARCDEYGAALARSGQARSGSLDLKEGKALLDELAG
jgi:hypothetical protein